MPPSMGISENITPAVLTWRTFAYTCVHNVSCLSIYGITNRYYTSDCNLREEFIFISRGLGTFFSKMACEI